ncbi:hypothetical protein WCX49_05810 [Sulfurimonas sp. HSL-1656]|uniref:hypothetical protein n=1 Tax=Thiomicrolovo subterrani TaxID=3131934 RepID=UPI0031F96C8C
MRNYLFNTDIGTFEIRQAGHERYELWIEEEMLGEYESPEKAAEDVAAFNTDYPEWDRLENEYSNVPAGLDDWSSVTETIPEA